MSRLPDEIVKDLERARRLEWWTLAWMASVLLVMGLAMGGSQAMKTAWIEDLLSLVPAAVFLIASHWEAKPANRLFPFGYHRVHSLASLIAAVALASVGAFLIYEAASTLIRQEHPTIDGIRILGHDVWLGWLMIAALAYSVVPPVILGRIKQPIAERLMDEVLDTDAKMQRADWMTGLAGMGGILGVGLGFWWADAAAAGLISFSILKDGVTALKVATAELVDGMPRALGKTEPAEDAEALARALETLYPGAEIRLRETGRYIRAQVCGVHPDQWLAPEDLWPGEKDRSWRLIQISYVPPDRNP